MINLSVGNSFSRVGGLTDEQFKVLREKLSYKVDPNEAFFGGYGRPQKRYLISKRGDFPSGLLGYVEKFLGSTAYRTEDTRRKPLCGLTRPIIKLGTMKPRPSQRAALRAALLADRGIIRIPTRGGKSLIMGMIYDSLQLRTLIVVPSVGLRDQLRKDFEEWFGPTSNVVIENIDSARLMDLTDFDILILDEAHHAAAATYRELNKKAWGGIYYRFFFTATPFRTNSEEQLLMESITGQVIFSMTYQDALREGSVVPIEAYFVDVPEEKIESNNWRTVVNQGIIKNKSRNAIISRVLGALAGQGEAVLCLLKEIAHGREIEATTGLPFANGQDGLVRMRILEFNLREINGLIGTVGVLGEGMTLPPAEYVIIAGGGKSRIQLMQNIGRIVGNFPGKDSAKVILLRDRSHKYLRRHFNAQLKTLREEYGVKPVRLEVPNV